MDVLTLLRSKNRCLLRFEQASLRFLRETEGAEISSIDTALPRLEHSSKRILTALGMFDRKIEEAITSMGDEAKTPQLIDEARIQSAETDRIVAMLLDLDESVISRIHECRERIAIELSSSEKNKQLMGKFKSTWAGSSGEELDKTL